jgi:hypothetical protein
MNANTPWWRDVGIVRSVVLSALALAAAVGLFLQTQEGENPQEKAREKDDSFSLLCADDRLFTRLEWSEEKADVVLEKSDRWRRLDGTPVEDRLIQVRLGQLRGLRALPLAKDSGATLESMGLKTPKQVLTLKGKGATQLCRLSLGVKHPLKPMFSVRLESAGRVRMGWAKVPLVVGGLMNLNAYRVRTVLPVTEGQIHALELLPQVTDERFKIERERGGFSVHHAEGVWPADEERTEALLRGVSQLKGELVKQAQALMDADLTVSVHHPPHRSQMKFFVEESRVLCAVGPSVFVVDEQAMTPFRVNAFEMRSLQVVDYERADLIHLSIHDGLGRVFYYRRAPAARGVDVWYEVRPSIHGGEIRVDQAHRLSALQWDLHTLRARRRLESPERLDCKAGCAAVVVLDQDGEEQVHLRIERRQGVVLMQNKQGPIFEVDPALIKHWPFEVVR